MAEVLSETAFVERPGQTFEVVSHDDAPKALPAPMPEFAPFPKISRLNRDILITEKIDGTNAAIVVLEDGRVLAQSRTRFITPGKGTDNFGFAAWVEANKLALRQLGPGTHYGEWWGQGIQRTYGLAEKRFSLFNVLRWMFDESQAEIFKAVQAQVPALGLVPVMYRGPWTRGSCINPPPAEYVSPFVPDMMIDALRQWGSVAVPGWMRPEGIVVYHVASKMSSKVTLEGDAEFKKGKRDEHANVVTAPPQEAEAA